MNRPDPLPSSRPDRVGRPGPEPPQARARAATTSDGAVGRRRRTPDAELDVAALPRLHRDVLRVVTEAGPVTPRDVADRLPIGEKAARGVLARLEERGLITAGPTRRRRGRSRTFGPELHAVTPTRP